MAIIPLNAYIVKMSILLSKDAVILVPYLNIIAHPNESRL